jgi:hypothetical protein
MGSLVERQLQLDVITRAVVWTPHIKFKAAAVFSLKRSCRATSITAMYDGSDADRAGSLHSAGNCPVATDSRLPWCRDRGAVWASIVYIDPKTRTNNRDVSSK